MNPESVQLLEASSTIDQDELKGTQQCCGSSEHIMLSCDTVVHNDILSVINNCKNTAVVLLDISTAFNMTRIDRMLH